MYIDACPYIYNVFLSIYIHTFVYTHTLTQVHILYREHT